MKKRVSVLLSTLLASAALLWAVSAGPNSPTLGVNVAGAGVDWANPTNIYTSNDVRATAALAASGASDFLRGTGYGFALPSGTVNGIQLEIERSQTGTGLCEDLGVYIVKGGSETGTDHAIGGVWPVADAYKSYGGAADLWGTAWTVANINAADFGASVMVIETGGTDACTGRVDHMRITVDYTPGGAGVPRVVRAQTREAGRIVGGGPLPMGASIPLDVELTLGR